MVEGNIIMATITSCSTLVYTESTFETAVEKIAANGFRKIEIASLASYCRHFGEDEIKPIKIKQILEDNQLQPVALNYSTNRISDGYRYHLNIDNEQAIVRDKLQKTIRNASEAGIPLLCFGPGQRNETKTRDSEISTAAEFINEMAEYAKPFGVKIALEVPHCWLLCYNLEMTEQMFSQILSDNVGAVVDSSHWHVVNYDFDVLMTILKKRFIHIHLRDSAGSDTGDFKQNLELTPGRGEVDFSKFARLLDTCNFSGNVSIEFEYKGLPLADVDKQVAIGITYLKQCGWNIDRDTVKI